MNYLDQKLCIAVWENDIEAVSEAIAFGADVDCFQVNGNTPLHLASEQGCFEIAELLLQSGALVDKRTRGGFWTPLVHAVDMACDAAIQCQSTPDNRIIELLIEYGANVNEECSQSHRRTALYIAMHNLNPEAEQMLRDAGAVE